MKPEEARTLCIESLKAMVSIARDRRLENKEWVQHEATLQSLRSGDLSIVSGKRLAALEKVVAKADGLMKLDTATMKARTTWTEMQDALAELDALNGD